jgi:hypothetical protein
MIKFYDLLDLEFNQLMGKCPNWQI